MLGECGKISASSYNLWSAESAFIGGLISGAAGATVKPYQASLTLSEWTATALVNGAGGAVATGVTVNANYMAPPSMTPPKRRCH